MQSDGQRRPAQALLPSDGPSPPLARSLIRGEYVVEQLLNSKMVRCQTYYLVLWQGHASAADLWEPAEHLANCPERVAEYKAAAPRSPMALWAHQCRSCAARAGGCPAAPAAPSGCNPATSTPARMGSGGGGPVLPRLSHPLLVA